MGADALLVTGAGGFIGRHVVEVARHSYDVVAVEHRWQDGAELRAIVKAASPVACIHLGWHADPVDYLTAVRPNALSLGATLELAQALADAGCDRLVAAGSSAEYGPGDRPVHEDDAVAPGTVYGAAKAMCHELLAGRFAPPSLAVAWARIFNVTGPGEPAGRIVPTATRRLLAGEPIDLSPGTQVRDYIDVRDVASGLVALCGTEAQGAVNVSTGRATTLRAMLEAVAAVTGGADLLRFGARPFAPNETMYLVGDNGRLRAAGWVPRYDLHETARAVVEYWKERR